MTIDELRKQINECNEAISAIRTTGQKIQTINGRVEHADMGALIAERNRLEAELAEAMRNQGSASRDFGITFSYYGRS